MIIHSMKILNDKRSNKTNFFFLDFNHTLAESDIGAWLSLLAPLRAEKLK